jgi:FAD/FMN-containing dehydrogenase
VGVAGHALHGGFGFSSHTYGLALDWLVGATVVLANGTVVNASDTENQDLLWALRGAGSNFGIVASLRFKTFPVPANVTTFEVNLAWRNASAIVTGWGKLQDWLKAGGMPKEMNMRLLGNGFQTQLQGMYHGNSSALKTSIQPLLDKLGSTLSNAKEYGWMEAFEHYSYSDKIDIIGPSHQVFPSFFLAMLTCDELPRLTPATTRRRRSTPRAWLPQRCPLAS